MPLRLYVLMLALTHNLLHYNALVVHLVLVGGNRTALWLYTLLMLPGVLLHELSHAVTAKLLLLEVSDFSIGPVVTDDEVWLGYVTAEKADVFRNSIVGLAPLVAGTGAILLINLLVFDFTRVHDALAAGNWLTVMHTLAGGFSSKWSWLAVYLIFAVSANMFPSRADRRYWPPVLLFLLLILAIAWVMGVIPALTQRLVEPINWLFRWLMLIFGFALVIDLPILLLFAAGTRAVTKP